MDAQPLSLQQILDAIYGGNIRHEDLAPIILKIAERLGDEFYENPPSVEQHRVMRDLQEMANQVAEFFK